MHVWRIEDDHGYGPYNPLLGSDEQRALSRVMCDDHCSNPRHHTHDDFAGPWRDEVISGCPGPDELKNWFDGYLEIMNSLGYQVSVYEVDDQDVELAKGGKECRFPEESGILVGRFPILED